MVQFAMSTRYEATIAPFSPSINLDINKQSQNRFLTPFREMKTLLFGQDSEATTIIENRLSQLPFGVGHYFSHSSESHLLAQRVHGVLSDVKNVICIGNVLSILTSTAVGYYLYDIGASMPVVATTAPSSAVLASNCFRGVYLNSRAWFYYKDSQSKIIALGGFVPIVGSIAMLLTGLGNNLLRTIISHQVDSIRGVYTIEN